MSFLGREVRDSSERGGLIFMSSRMATYTFIDKDPTFFIICIEKIHKINGLLVFEIGTFYISSNPLHEKNLQREDFYLCANSTIS